MKTFILLMVSIIIVFATREGDEEIADITNEPPKSVPTVPELIKDEGYLVQSHYVTTTDGYILNLHRIPRGKNDSRKNGKVAFLQHGLLTSSADWVLLGANRSLAFILAEEGYDVWMGNARGNRYSRNHTTLDPDSGSEFWDFSWHEIGTVDVPQSIDYILNLTNVDDLYYVGHSQGTTVSYVMCSTLPQYNAKLRALVSLSPVIYVGHIASPLMRTLAHLETVLTYSRRLMGLDELLPGQGLLARTSSALCAGGLGSSVCDNALFALCGFNARQLNADAVSLIMAQAPAGSSTKQLLHYIQEINSGEFRWYDYGYWENMRRYGEFSPRSYDLGAVTAPSYLLYARNDWMTDAGDVERAYGELGNGKELVLVADDSFSHLDFVYGVSAPKLVYQKVLKIFAEH